MLSSSQRLSTKMFEEVMKKGRVTRSSFLLLRSFVNGGETRISASVSKKEAKTATMRNQMRRRIYEAIRPLIPSIKEGVHAIIFGNSAAFKASPEELAREIQNLFVKGGIVR